MGKLIFTAVGTGIATTFGGIVLGKIGKYEMKELLDFIAVASLGGAVALKALDFLFALKKVTDMLD